MAVLIGTNVLIPVVTPERPCVDWYGPDDPWPAHGRGYFRGALNHARTSGWWLQKFSSHSYGKVVCGRDLPGDGRCEFLVFSSGKGADGKALELRALVDRCPHRSREPATSALDVASSLLDEADLLMAAAQKCIDADQMGARAEELLDLAAESAAKADGLLEAETALDRAQDMESAARDERALATDLADAAGYPTSAPVQAEPLLDEAAKRAATAKRRLGPSSRHGRRREELRERLQEVRDEIESIKTQLEV